MKSFKKSKQDLINYLLNSFDEYVCGTDKNNREIREKIYKYLESCDFDIKNRYEKVGGYYTDILFIKDGLYCVNRANSIGFRGKKCNRVISARFGGFGGTDCGWLYMLRDDAFTLTCDEYLIKNIIE